MLPDQVLLLRIVRGVAIKTSDSTLIGEILEMLHRLAASESHANKVKAAALRAIDSIFQVPSSRLSLRSSGVVQLLGMIAVIHVNLRCGRSTKMRSYSNSTQPNFGRPVPRT